MGVREFVGAVLFGLAVVVVLLAVIVGLYRTGDHNRQKNERTGQACIAEHGLYLPQYDICVPVEGR